MGSSLNGNVFVAFQNWTSFRCTFAKYFFLFICLACIVFRFPSTSSIHLNSIHENIHFYCMSSGSTAVVRVPCRLSSVSENFLSTSQHQIQCNWQEPCYLNSELFDNMEWHSFNDVQYYIVEDHSRGEFKSFWYIFRIRSRVSAVC